MSDLAVISSDSHVMEPADLWVTRLDRGLRDQAPRVAKNEDAPGYSFVGPGLTPHTISGSWAAGKDGEALKRHLGEAGYEAAHPGGWDPAARLDAQATDGLVAEVLYTTLGAHIYRMPDVELQRACFAAFNDWLAEYCAHTPTRLHGVAMIPLWDVAAGVKELERSARLGLKGGLIWAWPPEKRRYHSEIYHPLWAAAQDLQMPISLHIVSGMGEESRVDFSDAPMRYMNMIHEVQRSLSDIILGGVLERFPGLQIVAAECDTGWLPHFMQRMDRADRKFGAMIGSPLELKPSEYVKRQVWATFLDDAVGAAHAAIYGEDNFMWGSDFPHSDSTFPHSREVIEKNFAGVPERIARKVVFENAARLYRIDLN